MWKVKTLAGTFVTCTSHTSDVVYDDGSGDGPLIYKARTGATPTSVHTGTGTGVDSVNIFGTLDTPDITDVDLLRGFYDRCRVTIYLINYNDLSMGHMILFKGVSGEVKISQNTFELELRSLTQILQQQIGQEATPLCNADFCDDRCGLDIADFTFTTTVTEVIDDRVFKVGASGGLGTMGANKLSFGKCSFTDGNNDHLSYDIKYNDAPASGAIRIELQEAAPIGVQVGDSVILTQGCDRLFATCQGYLNTVHFRGFPFILGVDATIKIIPVNSSGFPF